MYFVVEFQLFICKDISVGPALAASLEPLAHHWNPVLSLFFRQMLMWTCRTASTSSYSWEVHSSNRLYAFLSWFLDVIKMSMSLFFFLVQQDSGILCQQDVFLWYMPVSLEVIGTYHICALYSQLHYVFHLSLFLCCWSKGNSKIL